MSRDVIITGLPRSGTTLATALVDGLDNTLALSEPEGLVHQCHKKGSNAKAAMQVADYFSEMRGKIANGEPILDRRSAEGRLATNYLSSGEQSTHSRSVRPYLPDDLTTDFVLACKHNALFTALLPELVELKRFKIFAIVRSPLRLLDSWQAVPFPIREGRLPAGEPFWTELAKVRTKSAEVAIDQAKIIELFFSRFISLRNSISIIRYEDMVGDPYCFQHSMKMEAKWLPDIQPPKKHEGMMLGKFEKLDLIREFCPSIQHLYSMEELTG